jgi:uncharacterized OsmC-like protein
MSEDKFRLKLTQESDFRFVVEFPETALGSLVVDESPPVGAHAGPDPARLLATSVGNCLAASLLFALRKFKNQPEPITAEVEVTMVRNEAKRLRIGNIAVALALGRGEVEFQQLERVLAQFEDFCIVTQSVRGGIPIQVSVADSEGRILM